MEVEKQRQHYVLVHGACHGAWCWYKLKPRLESAGHRVTALDLSASGIDLKTITELRSLGDYSGPLMALMASLPPGEKVILVGHSLGGLNLALAMDKHPEKISAAVFLTAFLPDSVHAPSYVLDKFFEMTPKDAWLDTQFSSHGNSEEPLTTLFFGPLFLSTKLYQLSPIEDLTLATMLTRLGSLFQEDLSKAKKFSIEGFESVPRVYVVCNEDKAITEKFQRWMIDNSGVGEVMEIIGSDHMPMFSKPQQLCDCLLSIATKYNI